MIIISQLGRRYNFDNIIFYDCFQTDEGAGEVVCRLVNNEQTFLGSYDSMERAEEIVREIDELYLGAKALRGSRPAEEITAISLMKKIYTMPKE